MLRINANAMINLCVSFSATISRQNVFNLSASGADDFSVVAAVHAEGEPEEWPEKAEETHTPSVGSTSRCLPPCAHSIKTAHTAWHWRMFPDNDDFFLIIAENTLVEVWHGLLAWHEGLLTAIVWWWHVVIEACDYGRVVPWLFGGGG